MSSEVVRLISGSEGLILDACDGQRTIAQAIDVFSYIDPNFKNWGTNVAGEATPETPVAVYEIFEDANFAEMFGALTDDPAKLVLAQGQILNFVEKYGKWLRKDGWATFFLFRAAGEFFVVFIGTLFDGGLGVGVCQFEFDFVWSAGYLHRLVVPKL